MNILVVESPAKAKTINKYLGPGYRVLASYGHVRDLPAKDGSVRPDQDFAMSWEVDARAQKRLNEIADAVKNADKLILATDPDREGEAISWHVLEFLKQKRALGEYFEEDWSKIEPVSVEPGHQAEWVWLLKGFERITGCPTGRYRAQLLSSALRFCDTTGCLVDEGDASGNIWFSSM